MEALLKPLCQETRQVSEAECFTRNSGFAGKSSCETDLLRLVVRRLNEIQGSYLKVTFAGKDDFRGYDRQHYFFETEIALETIEILQRAHRDRERICRSPSTHSIFSANPSEKFQFGDVALMESHGCSTIVCHALIRPKTLERYLADHPTQCACELPEDLICAVANPDTREPRLSFLQADYLPGWDTKPPWPDFDAWALEINEIMKTQPESASWVFAIEAIFDKFEQLPRGYPGTRKHAGMHLARVAERVWKRDTWVFLCTSFPFRSRSIQQSSDHRVRVAIPVLGNEAVFDSFSRKNTPLNVHLHCPVCGPFQEAEHHWGLEWGAPLRLLAEIPLFKNQTSFRTRKCIWLDSSLAMKCARFVGPKGYATASRLHLGLVTQNAVSNDEHVTLVLPIDARLKSPAEIRRLLNGMCPFKYLETPERVAALFEPPWDAALRHELEILYFTTDDPKQVEAS